MKSVRVRDEFAPRIDDPGADEMPVVIAVNETGRRQLARFAPLQQ